MALPVTQPPQRIVSLLSSATEILFGLGLGERVVGISHECDWPPACLTLPRATRSLIDSRVDSAAIDRQVHERLAARLPLYEIDIALLAQLKPDLIITQAQCDVCAIRYEDVVQAMRETLRQPETPILALQPQSLAEILEDVTRVGEATHASAAAAEYRQHLQSRVNVVDALTSKLAASKRPRVACIEWTEPLMLAGNWTPRLIELAGGISLLAEANQHSAYHAWQEVVAADPEVIIIAPCGFDLARSRQESRVFPTWPHWQDLCAVRQGRVFVLDGNAYLNRSGPRIVETLEILAHLIQPELFPPVHAAAWQRFS